MKVITAIYLNCRPELRDEWLASADVDQEIEDSLVGGVLTDVTLLTHNSSHRSSPCVHL